MYEDLMIDLDLCARGEKTGYHDVELCGLAYSAIKSLTAQLAALQAENTEKDQIIEALTIEVSDAETILDAERKHNIRVEAERDAAHKEIERMKDIMRQHGIMVIPSKYPGGRYGWNVRCGAQGEKYYAD